MIKPRTGCRRKNPRRSALAAIPSRRNGGPLASSPIYLQSIYFGYYAVGAIAMVILVRTVFPSRVDASTAVAAIIGVLFVSVSALRYNIAIKHKFLTVAASILKDSERRN